MSKETDWLIRAARDIDSTVIPTSVDTGGHAKNSDHFKQGTGGKGLAVDFDFIQKDREQRRLNLAKEFMRLWRADLDELIYAPMTTGLGNQGQTVNLRSFYGAATFNAHFNHVHVSAKLGHFHAANIAAAAKPAPLEVSKPMSVVIEFVAAVPRPGGGGYEFGRRGHVYAFGAAKDHHYGGWPSDMAGPDNRSGRDCIGLVPTATGLGYWLVSDAGEVYAYGDAKWTGNYDVATWGSGPIIGAYANDKPFRNDADVLIGGLTMIRDDGINANLYDLPAVD